MDYGGSLGAANRIGKGNQPGPHAITSTASGLNYDYDANGNMILHAQGDSYSWDYRNRLSSVTKDGVTTNYRYDHADQRVSKKASGASLADLYISKDYEIRQNTAYKYIMAAGQRVARIQSPVAPAQAQNSQLISLQAGWNFVSLTVEPDQPQAADSFAVIASLIESVYTFDADAQQYQYYIPGNNSSTLTELRAHQGYLIKISNAAEWQVNGVPASSPVSLVQGWNLVGLPLQSSTPPGFLPSIAGQYDAIWSYVSGNSWQQYSTSTDVPPMLQTLTHIQGGQAYWIKMKAAASYSPPNTINGTTRFYHSDHLGSTNFITDSSGAITQTTEYYPFGRARLEETADGQGSYYKYTGVELDKESGLAYHSARYYDNVVGRFVSVDPLFVETPGECGIQECNLYGYATNNPFRFIDPSGLANDEGGVGDFAAGYAIGLYDAEAKAAHYRQRNLTINLIFGIDTSKAGICNCEYRSPFKPSANAEEQFGRDMSPTAIPLMMLVSKRPLSAIGGAGKGLSRNGLAYQLKHLNKHLPNTPQANKLMKKEGAIHVFNNKGSLARVENAIFQRGKYTGNQGGAKRYGLRFNKPIGMRISSDGSQIPLHYGEMKVKNGFYHLIPRTGPRKK